MARELIVRIIGDSSSLNKSLDETSAKTESFGSKISKFAGLAGGAIAGAFAVEKIVDFGAEAVAGAESLQKSGEVITSTMGKSGDSVKTFADTTATGFGISAQTSEAVSAKFGILFQNMGVGNKAAADMTIKWQELAGSLSQIKGVDPTQVLNAMTLAAEGNARGLKQLGIDITTTAKNQEAANLGYDLAYAKLTAAQQSTVLFDLATKNLSQTMADAKAHSGDLSDQTRVLGAEWSNIKDQLGEALLPTLTKVATYLADNLPAAIVLAKAEFQKLQPTITAIGDVVTALVGIVREHWATISDLIKTAATIIKDQLKIVTDSIQLVADVLNGNWSKAWNDAKALVGDSIAQMRAMIQGDLAAIEGAALAIGNGVYSGISAGLAKLPGAASDALGALQHAIGAAASDAAGWAESIGSGIAQGILAGIGNIEGELESELTSKLHSALDSVKSALGIGSPSRLFADEVGQPIAQGVILGWVEGSAELSSTLSDTIQKAVDSARTVIANSRDAFSSAFGALVSTTDSDFSALGEAIKTPAEKALAALDAKQQTQQLQQNLSDARSALAQAVRDKTSSKADLAAAQQQVEDAQTAITRAALQERATLQRNALNGELALKQKHLDASLAALGASLSKEGATTKDANDEILKMLDSFGVSYEAVGQNMGASYLQGLKEALESAAGGAGALSGTIASAASKVPTISRVSIPSDIGGSFSITKMAAGGIVTSPTLALIGEAGPEAVVPLRGGGGGGVTVNVTVNGALLGSTVPEVAATIRSELLAMQKRGTNLGFA